MATTTTSCNSQRKVRTQGKKPGKSLSKIQGMTYKTSQTDHIEPDSNYIKIRAKRPVERKNIRPSKLVVTIMQINDISSIKILEI